MAPFTLKLFGDVVLARDGAGEIALPRKTQILLGYLALNAHRRHQRDKLAALLWRLAGSPVGNPPHPFTDVVKAWQIEAVSWMSFLGITTGTSPTLFSPDDYVTRGQLAAFFYRTG